MVCCLLLISGCLSAQVASEDTDTLSIPETVKTHFYAGLGYQVNEFVETGSSFAGLYVGLILKENVDLSIYYSHILDNFNQVIIFPEQHKYTQENVGFRIQYMFLKGRLRPLAGLGYQFSRISWIPTTDTRDTFTDNGHLTAPFIGANWLFSPMFTFEANLGYNYCRGVELIELENEDFNGLYAHIIVKMRVLSW